jgi:dephospho-CoA kinase
MRIIGFTGLSGAGKSLVIDYIKTKYGFPVFKTGDLVRTYLQEKNIPLTVENCSILSDRLSANGESVGVLGREKLSRFRDMGIEFLLVDSLRGRHDVNFYKQFAEEVYVIGIFANQHERYHRVDSRRRADDYANFEHFQRADLWQFNFGVGRLFCFSDYLIITQDRSRQQIYQDADDIIQKIIDKAKVH